MDNAVALVQAYLRVDGYFTVTEYPLIVADGKGEYRAADDLDVPSFLFLHAGRLVPRGSASLSFSRTGMLMQTNVNVECVS